jgi:5-formyltetrahydrofolate cyclo-ligase
MVLSAELLAAQRKQAEKARLRAESVARVRALLVGAREASAERASVTLNQFLRGYVPVGAVVSLYAATKTELSCAPADLLLRGHYQLAYPRMEASQLLTFRLSEPETLAAQGSFLLEPSATDPAVVPDAIVLPGRGFDRFGVRLGHGAGWYDRTLAQLPSTTLLIGLAFDFQIVEELPRTAFDRWAHWLITDSGPPLRCTRPPESVTMPSVRQDGT